MRKKLIFALILIFILASCSEQNTLEDAQTQIDNAGLNFKIPHLKGMEINYIQLEEPPRDNKGNLMGSNYVMAITYTENKGEKYEAPKELSAMSNRRILFGPYKGEPQIKLHYSNLQNQVSGTQEKQMNGYLVQTLNKDNQTFIFYNYKYGSIDIQCNDDSIQKECFTIAANIFEQNK